MRHITLRQARKRARLTQVQLAFGSGVAQDYVSKLELGKIAEPSFSIVLRLAKTLGIDPQALKFGRAAADEAPTEAA